MLAVPLVIPLAAAERWDVGLTPSGARIEASAIPGASTASPTVLLIGGLAGEDPSVQAVNGAVRQFEKTRQGRRAFRLLSIPLANPDRSRLVFPPTGVAYRDNPESFALWRWIAVQAPDLVIVAGNDGPGLAAALSQNEIAGVGKIPARDAGAGNGILKNAPKQIARSEADREIERRTARTPRQAADELAQYYGHEFPSPIYIYTIALMGQLRLGHLIQVEQLVAPYVNGSKDSLARPSSLHLAGHLIFADLARRTGNKAYKDLALKAANLGFTPAGEMKESMPFHGEMSDSVFMGCPILAAAGKLTGERKYFDMAARHLAFMQKLDLRPDGLYRHSPLTDAAWGRGNAFPALGLALTLSDFPKDHPDFQHVLLSYQQHMAALARYQDADGMWHEVIDQPASYPEYTATAMIATAMLRGIHNGWLNAAAYQPRVDKAWRSILARTGPDGKLMDVCESTNKQKSLKDYLDRAAILGRDPRGGAMALLFATEMAGLE